MQYCNRLSRRLPVYLRLAVGLLLLTLVAGGRVPVATAQTELDLAGAVPMPAHADRAAFVPAQAPQAVTPSAPRAQSAGKTALPAVRNAPVPLSPGHTGQPAGASSAHKVIYLTFDDGPTNPWTQKILSVLAQYHAHATFFVIGQSARVHPELLKAIVAGGNVIGNHTWDHPNLTHLTRAAVLSELKRTQKVLGPLAASCMRPPYGSANRSTHAVAAQLGMKLVMWDVDPLDWTRPGTARIVSRILSHATPGATVLMHDGVAQRAETVAALSIVLRELTQRGYRFETEPVCRH